MFNMKILFIVINAIRVSAHRREFLRIEHSCPELCFWQLFLLLDYKKKVIDLFGAKVSLQPWKQNILYPTLYFYQVLFKTLNS